MKRIIVFALLIILFSCQFTFADDATIHKKNRQKEVISLSYTMFFNNNRFDEMSIYLSTLQKNREGSLMIYDVVSLLAKNLVGSGWFRTPINYQQDFTRDKTDISVIQRIDGIQVVINKDGVMASKVFDFNQEPKDIVLEVFSKLFGSEA
jgi:hypothetical protein